MMIIQEFSTYLKFPCILHINAYAALKCHDQSHSLQSAFQIHEKLLYYIFIYLHIYGLVIDPYNDLLPAGLIAQQVEHCTGTAGLGSNPRSGLNLSGLSRCCLSSAKMRWSNSFKSLNLQYLFYLSGIDNLQNSCLFSKKLHILENNLERKWFWEALTIITHKFKWVRNILFPKEKHLL